MKKSQEDYLESILTLSKKNKIVRSIDVAKDLDFSKPSVSVAMKKLRDDELITINEAGHISLTQKGLECAVIVYEKHTILFNILIHLGVDKETALKDACKIEHDLSEETFNKIKDYYKKHIG